MLDFGPTSTFPLVGGELSGNVLAENSDGALKLWHPVLSFTMRRRTGSPARRRSWSGMKAKLERCTVTISGAGAALVVRSDAKLCRPQTSFQQPWRYSNRRPLTWKRSKRDIACKPAKRRSQSILAPNSGFYACRLLSQRLWLRGCGQREALSIKSTALHPVKGCL